MNTLSKLLVATAAVVVVAVAGFYFLPRDGGGIGGPGPSPSATAGPTPSPAPIAIDPGDVGRVMQPGTYTFGPPFLVPFSMTFGPGGWTPYGLVAGEAHFGIDQSDAPEPYVAVEVVRGVYHDPCHPEDGLSTTPRPLTVDTVVTFMTNIVGFEAGPVTETSIDGRPAKTFTMSNAIDTSTAGCTEGEMLPILQSVGALDVATNGNTSQTWWVLDVEGRTVVIAGEGLITSADPDVETVMSVLETLSFE